MTKTLTEQIVHIQNDLDVVFNEVVKLEKRLEIAKKALSDIEDGYSESTCAGQTVRQALKEMKGVK